VGCPVAGWGVPWAGAQSGMLSVRKAKFLERAHTLVQPDVQCDADSALANEKRVRRRSYKLGICRGAPTSDDGEQALVSPRSPNLVSDLQAKRPDQVWAADVT